MPKIPDLLREAERTGKTFSEVAGTPPLADRLQSSPHTGPNDDPGGRKRRQLEAFHELRELLDDQAIP